MYKSRIFELGICVGLVLASVACSPSSGPATDGGAGTSGGLGGGAPGGHGASGGLGGLAGGAGGAAGGGGNGDLACLATKTFACPGIDGSQMLGGLSTADATTFCGCLAAYAGGYGAPLACTCPDGSPGALAAPPSQSACVAAPVPPGCNVTLSDYTTCTNLFWAKPCDGAALLSAATNPACAFLNAASCQ
jgi:hypothetical protein